MKGESGGGSQEMKPGDWRCPKCQNVNFSSRDTCKMCDAPRGQAQRLGMKPGDWICPRCGDLVFASKFQCKLCGTPKPNDIPDVGGDMAVVAVGYLVEIRSEFESNNKDGGVLQKGLRGQVKMIDEDGDALVEFEGHQSSQWVRKADFGNLQKVSEPAALAGGPGAQGFNPAGMFMGMSGMGMAGMQGMGMAGMPGMGMAAMPSSSSGAGGANAGLMQLDVFAGPTGGPGPGMKPGDWVCPKCANTNFSKNAACQQCNHPRGMAMRQGMKPGDWICPRCGDLVFASKSACKMCKTPRPHEADTMDPRGNVGPQQPMMPGLAAGMHRSTPY